MSAQIDLKQREATLLKSIVDDRDSEAFAEFYRRMGRPALSLAQQITSKQALSEEAVQEAMLRVCRFSKSFRGERDARAWVLMKMPAPRCTLRALPAT